MVYRNFPSILRPTLAKLCDDVIQTFFIGCTGITEWNCIWCCTILAITWSAFLSVVYHDIWICCVSVPVLVAGFLTSLSWHAKCIRIIWYVFPTFSEVICLPFLSSGVPHLTCYLEFRVFRRQTIVAWPIESTDLVIFLALNDFLNVAKSHLNTFLFKVLVVFFCCMDGIYIILIIKAGRIRIESCRLNDTFEEQRLSFSNEPLVKSWAKCFPLIPKWIQFGVVIVYIYCFSDTIFAKVGNSWPVGIFVSLFTTKKVFCQRYFGLFLVEDLEVSIRLIKWHTQINLCKPGIIVFNPVKIADSKSTPMKLIFFRFGFADRISSPNLPNVFSTLVKCSIIGPRWTGAPPSMVFTRRLFL